MRNLPPNSKQWWAKSRQLMSKKSRSGSSIPALKQADGKWILDSEEKANHLADTFASKCVLLPPEHGRYTDVQISPIKHQLGQYRQPVSLAYDVLRGLRDDGASGPDLLSARVLRHCASQLASPVASITRRIIETSVWPEVWLTHWIVPLFKKKSVFDAKNYRVCI